MTQLFYHPAFDPYNTLLRILRILDGIPSGLDRTSLRILDFYLLFPELLSDCRLTTTLRAKVRKLRLSPRFPYDRMPTPKALFDRMEPSFEAAIQTMVTRGFVTDNEGTGKMVVRAEHVPRELLDLASEHNKNETGLMELLCSLVDQFGVHGPDGLKARSGLVEYRYDAI